VARRGILINDLQRTPWPTPASMASRRCLQASEDDAEHGPISVLRGFQAGNSKRIATEAGRSSTFRISIGAGFSLATEHHPLNRRPY